VIQGIVPRTRGVDEFGGFVKSESAKFSKITKDADIEGEN